MADEMLFCRSWFLPTESSSSEENEGRVSRLRFSSSSRRLHGLGQLPSERLPSPSLSPNPAEAGGGGGGGGGGDRGRIPPVFPGEASPFPGPIPEPGGIPIPGFFLPDFRKSKKDAMKPAFSGSLSSAYKG